MFLPGQTRPRQFGAAGAHLPLHGLQHGHGLAGAHPWFGQGPDADGPHQPAVVDGGRAIAALHVDELGKGNELAIARLHFQGQQVGGIAAVLAIELHNHLAHLTAFKAVVDVIGAKAGAQRVDHAAQIHPQRGHLQAIGNQLDLGGAGAEAGGHPLELTGGSRGPDEGLGLFLKTLQGELTVAGIEEFDLNSPLGAEAAHRGGLAELHYRACDLAPQLGIEPFAHRPGGGFGAAALLDRRQAEIEVALVGAAVAKGAAGVEVGAGDQGLALHHLPHLVEHGLGGLDAQAIGQDHHPP